VNTPPLLLAAACALWGLQTGQWFVAAAAAVAIEASRVVPLRWTVTQAHFNRLSDFCSVLIVAVAGYLYLTFGNPRALLMLFQWLPVALLPLALAQAWGNRPQIGVAAFVWTLRKDPAAERHAFNIGYPYFALWLLAASATNVRGPAYFGALVALAGWALWAARPRRHTPAIWVALLAVAAGIGYGAQHGLSRLQGWIEDSVPEWLSATGSRTDPYQSRTDLGHIGVLKQDDTIVLRVRPDGAITTPLLLHRASYNGYFGTTWMARNAPLTPRPPDAAARWILNPSGTSGFGVTIFDWSPRGNPVLSLPGGTMEIRGLEALGIMRNGLGTVQAEIPPGHFRYIAMVDAGAAADAAPDEEDLRVPRSEQALLNQVAAELGLAKLPAERAVAEVRRFFTRGFGYSLWQPATARGTSPLADFLLTTRAGHCEYFASATALLLRTAGVPARYATGFSTQEYSRLENAYVVRARHAHAWAKAYVNGAWIDVDTTPPIWASVEAQEASSWAPLSDLWSWTRFRLSRLAAGARDESTTAALWAGIAALLAAWLVWRLYRQRRLLVIGARERPVEQGRSGPAGGDSEFFLVERTLARYGLPREPGEPVMAWLARIASRLPPDAGTAELNELALLHYRYRFDPAGLARIDRDRLTTSAQSWLARMEKPHRQGG
jgi:protein-glutamine gamma-glutamyltransferase